MSYVKHLVSKKKKRFIEDGFDLDLAYIKPNIVAMGFPSENMEGLYRNNLDDVLRFLELKHKDKYKIYNLCSERVYSPEKFNKRVERFPFDDHNAPPFELIEPFCKSMKQWLMADPKNVSIVHCKAGKGRTGVMICAYLIYIGIETDAEGAMDYYAEARTTNKKGVTIPSQRRYVRYFGEYVNKKLIYKEEALLLNSLTFVGIPTFNSGTCSPSYIIYQKQNVLEKSKKPYEVSKAATEFTIKFLNPLPICGDVKIDFFHKDLFKKERMFVFWVNTFFLQHGIDCCSGDRKTNGDLACVFEIPKKDLDKANKDKKHKLFPESFKIRLNVTISSDSKTNALESIVNRRHANQCVTDGLQPGPENIMKSSNNSKTSPTKKDSDKKETLQSLSKQHNPSKDFTNDGFFKQNSQKLQKSRNLNSKETLESHQKSDLSKQVDCIDPEPSKSNYVDTKSQGMASQVDSIEPESNKTYEASLRCRRVEEFVNVPQSPLTPSPTNSLEKNLNRSFEDITLAEEPLSDDDEDDDDLMMPYIQSTRV